MIRILILILSCLLLFVPALPVMAEDTLETALVALESAKLSSAVPEPAMLQSLAADIQSIGDKIREAGDTRAVELLELQRTNLQEKHRLIEAQRLFAEERKDRLEKLHEAFRHLQENEQTLGAVDATSLEENLVEWIRREARWKEARVIAAERIKVADAQTELKRKELVAFRDKVEAARRETVKNRESLASLPDDDREHSTRVVEFKEALQAIHLTVISYLAERLEFLQNMGLIEQALQQRQDAMGALLHERLLPLGEEKLNAVREEQAAARVGSEAEEKRFAREQIRLQQGDRHIEQQVRQLENRLEEAEKQAEGIKNEFLARLIRENPRLELSNARMSKENLRLREENLNLLRAAARTVTDWERDTLRLQKKGISRQDLTVLSAAAQAHQEKYSDKIKLARDEELLLRREADSGAEEAEEISRRMDEIRDGKFFVGDTTDVLLLLEKKQGLIFARLEQQEERVVLAEKRREGYERRMRSVDRFLVALKQSGAVIIFGNRLDQYFHFLLALLATFFLALLLSKVVFRWVLGFTASSRIQVDHVVARVISRPLILAVMILGFYFALELLTLPLRVYDNMSLLIRGLFVLDIAWLVMRAVDIVIHFVRPLVEKTESKLDDQLLPIASRLAKFLIGVIGVILFIENFGYPATSILTGLGIGGLAFALAAKDTLANFFGSMVIFSDKVFSIGDWIKFGDNEGIVEEIGLRSTSIRKFDNTVIVVPNSTVAQANITNISRFQKRRICYTLGLTYNSGPDGMEQAVEIIRTLLNEHPEVANDHYIFFTDFGPCSLDIMIYCFAETTVWREYLRIRQEVNVMIMRKLDEAGLSIAFPTQTLNFDEDALEVLRSRRSSDLPAGN